MSDQVLVDVVNQSNRASIEQCPRLVEVTAPAEVRIVEVLHPGPQGATATELMRLADVDSTDRTNGSVLYYDAVRQKAVFDSIETKINLTDGGNF